jgi:hypothetical protein
MKFELNKPGRNWQGYVRASDKTWIGLGEAHTITPLSSLEMGPYGLPSVSGSDEEA